MTADVQIISSPVIDRRDFILIPNSNIGIAKFEQDYSKGENWEDSHFTLAEKYLWMPRLDRVIPHYQNVVQAYRGNGEIYDLLGNQITDEELEDVYLHLTKNHINNGAWSWINAKFTEAKEGFNKMGLEVVSKVDLNERKFDFEITPLEEFVLEDCYVDLDSFNSQGLPTKRSNVQKYSSGDNLYFRFPRKGYVARFGAGSGRAGLDCDRDPSYSDPSLGVLACAEGAHKKD